VLTLDRIRAVLSDRAPGVMITGAPPPRRTSAVLVPLYEHLGTTYVVLTRRASHLRSHSGEVSFPGGRQDDEDADLWATAVREANEEIGLDPDVPVRIGELDHLRTVSSASHINPYVAELPGGPPLGLEPNPSEVEAVLHVSLDELLVPEYYREEVWAWPEGGERSLSFFELGEDTLWGATATMLRLLLTIGLGLEGRR
jgi:8-oxo-dGTP pyrophosphatase MutT (NUDIX family)